MKKFLLTLFALTAMLTAKAVVNVDFSSRFEEGTNTIQCLSSWGWYSTSVKNFEIEECDYLYISYDATCNFNLIIRDLEWQTAYSVTCKATEKEASIRLEADKKAFTEIVIQNHAEGEITINKLYFCTEAEYYNPQPDDVEGARSNLSEIYTRYYAYLDESLVGDDFGQFPADLHAAFVQAMKAAEILDTEAGMTLTVDELNAMSQAIVDTYLALIAGQHQFQPADGYYRVLCARQFQQGDEESGYTYYTKGIYSNNGGTNGWKTVDREDPAFLWTLERQTDNTYMMKNASNNLILSEPQTCSTKENYVSFDPINKTDGGYDLGYPLSTEEDVVFFNFRMSTEAANDYKYIHAKDHNHGKGEEGAITVWCNSVGDGGASEWYLEPVDEAEAQEIINANNYGYKFSQLLADAKEKVAIANDRTRDKLITGAWQFSSPYSQNDLGGRDGGDLSAGVLIDGDAKTFWHSVWSAGSVEPGVHYLQIEFVEEVSGEIEFDFTRRNEGSNNVTVWGVYGGYSSGGEKYDYEWIADVETPYVEKGESIVTSFTIDSDKAYSYLRFYAEQTNSNKGYWHLSEFQLYALSDNPDNQASHMGDAYANLVAAIAQAENVSLDAVTKADYEMLKAAYDPFIAVFVDPTPLRDAIEAAEPALELCQIGTNPGQWSEATYEALSRNIEDAKAYDRSGRYTQAQTDAYVALLADADTKFLAAANRVSPDKYYAIRFASQELYEEQGWSTSNAISEEGGDLFDTYVCPAEAETLASLDAKDVRQGSYMFFTYDDKADIAFRFIPVDEDTYIIQHKASGLYIQCYGYDSWTGLTLTPTLFTVKAVGHGENILRGKDYAANDMACLHAQLSGHRLVTWHDDYVGCNSGLLLEELPDEGEPGSPLADYKPGEVTTMCYPVSVAVSEGQLYSVVGTYSQNDKVYVAMNKVSKAEAGQPVVYTLDGTYDQENEDDAKVVTLTVGTGLCTEPLNTGALQGTYESLDLSDEAIIFAAGKCELSTDETSHVSSNLAYLPKDAAQAEATGSYDLVLEVGGDLTAVRSVLNRLSELGDIYDTAGKLLRRNATLSDVQALPRGLYIFNDTKILVK